MHPRKLYIISMLLISLLLWLSIPVYADDIGVTGLDLTNPGPTVPSSPLGLGPAPMVRGPIEKNYQSPWLHSTDDWELLAQDSLEAFIPAGGNLAVYFNPETEQLGFVDPTLELTPTQWQAIQRAPTWLRADLYDNFRRFEYSFIADLVAQVILDAQDPYVDEIAFQAAHIAPGVVGGTMYLQLLTENIQYMYLADSLLDYVQIIDYGNSNDNDYWSTARYWVIEADSDTVRIEIPRDIYYWYIVHPKLSDEMPTYIDPATGLVADPPTGVFWRTYFWTHADTGCAFLPEYMANTNFLWAHTGAANPSNGAIGVLNGWINNVMTFGAGSERPIQPVRIYALHCGNCGEFSDITAAAGRTCLIPTICTTAYCEDHTWNEFWEGDWIHWEPVNGMINCPLVYENGWGKVFSAVFDWRGDGYVWTVTDRYSEGVCTLNVSVYDSTGKPADATRVIIKKNAPWGMFYDTWGITNSRGQVSFILGDNTTFYLRVDGPMGSYPPGSGQVLVIANSQAGEVYTWSTNLTGHTPPLGVAEAPEYPNPLDDYRLEINFQSEYETAYGTYFTFNEFAAKVDTGLVDFFVANGDNYMAYNALEAAQGFGIMNEVSSGIANFVLPTQETWYGVLSTRELAKNQPRVKVVAKVYQNIPSGVEEPAINALPTHFAVKEPYPNPFNPTTVLSYELPVSSLISLKVHDIAGRLVATLDNGWREAGTHQVTFDGSGLPSGIYIYRLTAGAWEYSGKMALMK